jgi:hypothetical protein
MLPTELLVHFIRVLEFFSRQMNWDGLVKLLLNSTGKWIYPTRIRSSSRVTKFIRHFSWSSLIRTSCEINEFNGT